MANVVNACLLVLILIGVPAISGLQLGPVQISSRPHWQTLVVGGLALAIALNWCGAFLLAKGRRQRLTWYRWIGLHALLLIVEFCYFAGIINFDWLKQCLLWAHSLFQ